MAGLILQIIMVIIGLVLLVVSVSSLARRKMTESFCVVWGIISVLIILAGILLRPVVWTKYISYTGLFLLILIGACSIWCVYFMSSRLSELSRKNDELAMQVSLLIHETEELKKEVSGLKGKE